MGNLLLPMRERARFCKLLSDLHIQYSRPEAELKGAFNTSWGSPCDCSSPAAYSLPGTSVAAWPACPGGHSKHISCRWLCCKVAAFPAPPWVFQLGGEQSRVLQGVPVW